MVIIPSAPDLGRAWLLLAMAYHEKGRFEEAATAYERSLYFVATNPEYSARYAETLSAYASLYRDTGQMEIAWKMQRKALRLYSGINDQAGIACVCKSLAIQALSQKHTKKARGYLRCAIGASKAAIGLDDDYFAALSSTQAWLYEEDKQYTAAESEYQHAIDALEASARRPTLPCRVGLYAARQGERGSSRYDGRPG
jgi:tetratricopeptide (TPR) repeat protein